MKYYILDVFLDTDLSELYIVREEMEFNYPPDMEYITVLSEVDYKFNRVHNPNKVTSAIDAYLIPKALGEFISKLN